MGIETQVLTVEELCPAQIEAMYAILAAYFGNVSWPAFLRDLRGKQKAILLLDAGRICGFSTQAIFSHVHRGRELRVVFSGDTIIEQSHWRSLALPLAWGRMMLALRRERPAKELYWLLTSKGYRTYRYLPVFFREYYPCCDRETPEEIGALLDELCRQRFGARYDSRTRVLAAAEGDQFLRPDLALIGAARLADPRIAFFERANPGHARGDELVCLCRFDEDNLSDFIRRRLGA